MFAPLEQVEAWIDYAAATFVLANIRPGGMFTGDGHDNEEEDEIVASAHEFLLDSLSDATHVGVIEAVTGINLRDQLTTELVNELQREIELRRFKRRN